MTLKVKIKRLDDKFADIPLPEYSTPGSSGLDARAALDEETVIEPGKIALVPTSLAIAIPEGYECQVRSRSGLAAKHGIFALNAPGTVDSDYRGEIKIILANFGDKDFTIRRGDRIAQLAFAKYEKINWEPVESLPGTQRGEGGFGSTGI